MSNIGSSDPAISVTFAADSPISRERASAKSRASALTESRMRDITPRLRKSGRASGRSFCRILCTFVRTRKSALAAMSRAPHDFRASLAHARMLRAVRILTAADLKAIERGLSRISREIETGRFRWSISAEDVHVNIERRLIALVGEAGKRLHTARSRNDQVATDLRLWLREAIDEIRSLLRKLQRGLLDLAEKHAATVMPGFTHLQVAQPVTFGHHLLAYFEMLERDRSRLADCRRRASWGSKR